MMLPTPTTAYTNNKIGARKSFFGVMQQRKYILFPVDGKLYVKNLYIM